MPRALLDQVAPGIVPILLIPPLPDAVVLDLVELAGVEVQPVGCGVVAKFLTPDQRTGIAAVQLAVGFVLVFDLAAQLVQGAYQFTRRIVLVAPVNRVVGMLHQQRGIDPAVMHL
ncbi:hypothetical protein D9M71_606800 [compost metagenome]